MKVVVENNGRKAIYVQGIDVKKINEISTIDPSYSLPTSIWGKTFIDNARIFDDENQVYNYIKFDETHELYFFEQNELNFILDHSFLNKLSTDDILNRLAKCRERLKWAQLNDNGVKVAQVQYMIDTLTYVLNLKINGKQLPLPEGVEIVKQPEVTGFQKFINLFTGKQR